jgi:hypothetical protein
MVPPQPRFLLKRPYRAGRAVGWTVTVAAETAVLVLALGLVLPRPLKQAIDCAGTRPRVGAPPWASTPRRSAAAASQVGYGPSMMKQFSSPRRFASFQLVSTCREVAFQCAAPVREVPSDALGAVRTVWVRDFTPRRASGRYYVTDNGISSWPFIVGPDVFDSAVRAKQRAVDSQELSRRWMRATLKAPGPPQRCHSGATKCGEGLARRQ